MADSANDHALDSTLRRFALWIRRHWRAIRGKRPPLPDMLWAWSSASWGHPPPRKRWWRK